MKINISSIIIGLILGVASIFYFEIWYAKIIFGFSLCLIFFPLIQYWFDDRRGLTNGK